ncbi:hypothetical protein DT87_01680 [Streptomyces sp. NTK 937]|nr:hypothetical protein DT87_01680 [Streptomyces sp. NTK 937]
MRSRARRRATPAAGDTAARRRPVRQEGSGTGGALGCGTPARGPAAYWAAWVSNIAAYRPRAAIRVSWLPCSASRPPART